MLEFEPARLVGRGVRRCHASDATFRHRAFGQLPRLVPGPARAAARRSPAGGAAGVWAVGVPRPTSIVRMRLGFSTFSNPSQRCCSGCRTRLPLRPATRGPGSGCVELMLSRIEFITN
jgi:hypothetical protein